MSDKLSDVRHDYVHCIGRTHVDFPGQSWCGRNIRSEFHFLGLDHAVENNRQGGRLVPCPACVAEATAYLASPAPAIPMPPLNDAMRAVLTNENCVYGTPDELYAALVNAAPAISESEDTERLEWLMHRLSGKALRDIGVVTSSGGIEWAREAIDAARKGEKS